MEVIDLSTLVRSACEDLSLIRENGIALSSEVDDGISITGNQALLLRAISNLIFNAYRYGKENGHINVVLHGDGEQITLKVEDDGIGISLQDIPKVFDRFYRADSSREKTGTGLGLALTKEIVEFHHGALSVESVLGEGSVFSIVFPKS